MAKRNKGTVDILIGVLLHLRLVLIDGVLHIWNGLFWTPYEDLKAARSITAMIQDEDERKNVDEAKVKKALDHVRCQESVPVIDIESILERMITFVCRNGTYLMNGLRGEKVSKADAKELYHTNCLNAAYDEQLAGAMLEKKDSPERFHLYEKHCPRFVKYVKSVFEGEWEKGLECLLEMIGYIISNLQGAKAAFFLIGVPNCGKSTLLSWIEYVLGEEMVSHIGLEELGRRFNIAEIHQKHLNISGEIPTKKIDDLAFFKRLTGGDIVKAERKNQPLFSFRFIGKLLFSGNCLPDFKVDGTDAVLERMVVLYFPKGVSVDQRDYGLLDGLKAETDAIVTLAMFHAMNVFGNNFHFSTTKASEELIKNYAASFHAQDDFLANDCEMGEGFRVYKSKLWEAYLAYCSDNCIDNGLSKNIFFSAVAKMPGVISKKGRINGGKPLALFEGLRLKINREETVVTRQQSDQDKEDQLKWERKQ